MGGKTKDKTVFEAKGMTECKYHQKRETWVRRVRLCNQASFHILTDGEMGLD